MCKFSCHARRDSKTFGRCIHVSQFHRHLHGGGMSRFARNGVGQSMLGASLPASIPEPCEVWYVALGHWIVLCIDSSVHKTHGKVCNEMWSMFVNSSCGAGMHSSASHVQQYHTCTEICSAQNDWGWLSAMATAFSTHAAMCVCVCATF